MDLAVDGEPVREVTALLSNTRGSSLVISQAVHDRTRGALRYSSDSPREVETEAGGKMGAWEVMGLPAG